MTERAKKLLWLYYKQGRKIRRVSGLPPLTFKAKKAGTLKNYRIYGNTETKTRSYSGAAPLSFPIVDGAVSNYRIYGQTSRNLFDETIYNKNVADNTIIYVPMYVGNVDYVTCSTTCPKTGDSVYDGNNSRYIFFISGSVDAGAQNTANGVSNGVPRTIPATNGYVTIAYRKIENYNVRPWEYQTMLNVGSTALPYEPYGESVGELVTDSQSEHYGKYAIPITNNSETANIYLDEPLRKVGDEAEYVDYAEQKRYNADGTNEDVTLPALPAQSSSNSLSVGTTVQPSSVAVDVGEIVSCGDRTANLFDENSLIGTSWYFDDEHYLVAVSQTSDNRPWEYNYSQFFITLQPGSYTFKIDGVATSNPYAMIAIYDGNSSLFSKLLTNISSLSTQITLSSITTLGFMIKIYDGKFRLSLTKSTTEPSEFEPYGYKIPVTLTAGNAETTDIYLDAPLAKSGDNADYIDYATQKRHNSDGTESTVTLPEIAVTAGTNTLTVGTEVQPSSVEIKGRIKAAGGD